jgi:hypothetical protein
MPISSPSCGARTPRPRAAGQFLPRCPAPQGPQGRDPMDPGPGVRSFHLLAGKSLGNVAAGDDAIVVIGRI